LCCRALLPAIIPLRDGLHAGFFDQRERYTKKA
jgi:hypothetical protein